MLLLVKVHNQHNQHGECSGLSFFFLGGGGEKEGVCTFLKLNDNNNNNNVHLKCAQRPGRLQKT